MFMNQSLFLPIPAVVFFCFFIATFSELPAVICMKMDPLASMNTAQLVHHYGYKNETHYVTTSDGYILTVTRIANENSKFPPILLQHGLFYASDLFVLRGPKHDLAFILADMGYDIWLPDLRGNTYSKKHVTLTPRQSEFWDFSWHEQGVIDSPAVIDFILETTGREKLFHLGHSMGTTIFYAMTAVRPEYNNKIVVHFSLAPIAYMGNMKANYILWPMAENSRFLLNMARSMGIMEVLPRSAILSKLLYSVPQNPTLEKLFLTNVFQFFGFDFKFLNKSAIPTFASHCPSGSSLKTIQHYAQVMLRDEFGWYSYGPKNNLRLYGSETSPLYNLSAITTKISFHYSYNDYLSSPKDVKRLAAQLPNVIGMYPTKWKNFNHIDYLWAVDSRRLLFDDIIRILERFSEPSSKIRFSASNITSSTSYEQSNAIS